MEEKNKNKKNKLLQQVLLKGSYVSKEDLEKAISKSKDNFIDYLLKEEIITKDLIGQAMAEYYGISYADINSNFPSVEQILKIPEKLAKSNRAVLFSVDEDKLVVATDRPNQKNLLDLMKKGFSNENVEIAYSLTEDIDEVLNKYRKPLKTRFSQIIKNGEKIAPEIINEIIDESLDFNASDIHFEPRKGDVMVRFRVDGLLREAGVIPKKYYQNIVNRIKVQANLKIDDHFSPQDGSIRTKKGEQDIDLRISIVPTLKGEKIVIRVLARYVDNLSLASLGFSEKDQKEIEKASKSPFGMILVTGPTGSGKTTTLYALLQKINNVDVNITTIEDPVEYQLPGLNQIQVNNQVDLTFANGLRSVVRQDPDIILVGEIRDRETVEIAVNAALTGHLLFSTFHSNDAATAIPRLLDMGTEPFLLASTLEMIVAQRLVRRVCEKCRTSIKLNKDKLRNKIPEIDKYFKDNLTVYKGKGCDACNYTGFDGRIAIFELIKITDEIQELISTKPSAIDIWKIARQQGSKTLFDDGMIKVEKGLTTIRELLRVASPKNYQEKK